MNLDESTLLTVSDNQVFTDLDNESAILNYSTGIYYGLDRVGMRIWQLLQSPITVGEIGKTLVSEYEVDEVTCYRDLNEIIQELYKAGLVEIQIG